MVCRSAMEGALQLWTLAAEPSDRVQDEGKYYAEQDRCGERKIERGVLAPIDDVTGKAAQRQVAAAEQKNDESGDDEHGAKDDQEFADVGHDAVSSAARRSLFRF